MSRYRILTLIPEDEPASYHVIDTGLDIEVAILDTKEQAHLFRQIRETIDRTKAEKLYLN